MPLIHFLSCIHTGELFDYIVNHKKVSEHATSLFLQQVLRGVAHCHSLNIVHRDLKPENLLVTGVESGDKWPNVKIADFGCGVQMEGDGVQKMKLVGTIGRLYF